jgi:(5-formylfuran-3-yl)methyl phosphate synthase
MADGPHRGAPAERGTCVTSVLASVASAEEAEIALAAGADLIDFKDPARGALGALPVDVIARGVARVAGRRPTSATIGDVPMEPRAVAQAVGALEHVGLDYVKVGAFPGADVHAAFAAFAALARFAQRGQRIVLVLFADRAPDFALVERARAAGFAGVMLDTADKTQGRLTDHVSASGLERFVGLARKAGLLCGLAGSLRLDDVPALVACAPDYLGFRGALCAESRSATLDATRVRAVCTAVHAHVHISREPRPAVTSLRRSGLPAANRVV